MNLNEDKLDVSIVALNAIYNFVIRKFLFEVVYWISKSINLQQYFGALNSFNSKTFQL